MAGDDAGSRGSDGEGCRKSKEGALTPLEQLLTTLHDGGVDFVIIGGVAARAHGSSRVTDDLDVCYARDRENLKRLATALAPLAPYPRGAPAGLPFDWSVETLRAGLNFPLSTSMGALDLLGEITGGGDFGRLLPHSIEITLFDREMLLLDIPWLIHVKRAAGLPKDFEVIAELEALQEETES